MNAQPQRAALTTNRGELAIVEGEYLQVFGVVPRLANFATEALISWLRFAAAKRDEIPGNRV